MMFPLLAVFAAVWLAPQDDPPAPPYVPKHKLTVKLSIEEKDGAWQFVIEGTSDLPDGTVLRSRVYALDEIVQQGERMLDEEALSPKLARNYHDFELKEGRFREVAFETTRRPYSLRYRAKVFFIPGEQTEAIAKRIADKKEFLVLHDIRRGTDADLERELKEAAVEFARELDTAETLYRDFKAQFLAQQKKTDLKAWEEWGKGWRRRVGVMRARNDERWNLWTAWLERQGRMRIDGFCERFDSIYDHATEVLKGDPDRLQRVEEGMLSFPARLEEDRETLGVDAPPDLDAIGALIGPYAEAVARLRMIADRRDEAAWKAEAEGLRARARNALLSLSGRKMLPRRGYEKVAALSEMFLTIFALAEKAAAGRDAPELPGLFKDHEAKVREFREYAGLK